jgi:hypothetical protein
LPELPDFRRPQLAELLLPSVERLLRHLELAADLHDGRATLRLPERLGDLLRAELAGPHPLSSAPVRGSWPASIVPLFRESCRIRIRGADHINDDLLAALLEDDDAVIAATEALYRDATTAAKGLGDVVEALNAITDGYAAVRWCGTFEALCTGDDDFALKRRPAGLRRT